MFSIARSLPFIALMATLIPSVTASPTPTFDIIDPTHVFGVDLSIPFWKCYEEKLIFPSVCKCIPYYGKAGAKRDVSEVVRSQGLGKRTIWIDDKCIVPAANRPDIIEWHGGCCDQACESWCGDSCLMAGEVCVSGKPQKPAYQDGGSYGSHGWKRDTQCPTGTEKCFIGGSAKAPIYDCVNTSYDLEHCGGCAIADPLSFATSTNMTSQDCTAITNVANVACNAGRCAVSSCVAGFEVVSGGPEGDRCERSEAQILNLRKYRLE